MTTIKLAPTTYTRSSTNRVSVTNPENMYYDTSHTDSYASLRGRNNGGYTYYCFIHGFDFSQVPSNATVNSFSVKIRCYRNSSQAIGSSYRLRLASTASSSSVISNTTTSTDISETVSIITIPTGNLTWSTLKGYGSGFSIDVVLRSSDGSYPYVYVYGAEIEVDYTLPNPRTITTSLTGDGTISPDGETTTYDGSSFELTITPTDTTQSVAVTHDGNDVTDQIVSHGSTTTSSMNLGNYTLVSGGFYGQGGTYFSGLVGKGVNNTTTTTNYYSSSSSTIAVFTYELGITLPSNSTIERVWCEVNGHAESTSSSNEYMCVQLISGNTNLSEELNFKSIGTSNSTQTLEATTIPTLSQLSAMKLQCRLGYYGGAINGATVHVLYDTGEGITHYTYSFTVSGDASIVVIIGSTSSQPELYVKLNGSWIQVGYAYEKFSGSWQLSDLSQIFDSEVKYVKGSLN